MVMISSEPSKIYVVYQTTWCYYAFLCTVNRTFLVWKFVEILRIRLLVESIWPAIYVLVTSNTSPVRICTIILLQCMYFSYAGPLAAGLLEVISPPASFYPNLDNLKETFGDPKIRVKYVLWFTFLKTSTSNTKVLTYATWLLLDVNPWEYKLLYSSATFCLYLCTWLFFLCPIRWRTKQNLDFSFLMMYAKSRGTYYVQVIPLEILFLLISYSCCNFLIYTEV